MLKKLGDFITPERSSSWLNRLAPYGILVFAGLVAFIVAGAGWEYTNSSEFCGTFCHTMPPEYEAYLISPHARVDCVECHIGRDYIATQFTRKAQDISHIVRYIGVVEYEVPIYAKKLRPASEVCERCHFPGKFSDDSMREFTRFDAEQNNEETTLHMVFRTGGGTFREGQGKGIHWHVENTVEYIATDEPHLEQEIPWVRVTYADSGETETFVDSDTELPADFVAQNADSIKTMDCMTCHNRVSHLFREPSKMLDDVMARGLASPQIPYFKQNALAVMEREYPRMEDAFVAISGLKQYYADNWPDFYAQNGTLVEQAVETVLAEYKTMVFPNMEVSWDTHPNNLGHLDSPGCFRCHDGSHLNEGGESIRIECNLCHTIPVAEGPDGTVPAVRVTDAFQPESHNDSNWLARHRFEFDKTCEGCHDVADAGGTSNTSFCSNGACHGNDWEYADLNAPGILSLTNVLDESLPTYPEHDLTWVDLVQPILNARCVACHGGTAGLYLDSYEGMQAGGNFGPALISGNAEESLLVQLQRSGHPNSLASRELDWIVQWINAGAPYQ
ncbi:MAG: NapC/NirT family cytochrome c [Caldilineaceae bacterium]